MVCRPFPVPFAPSLSHRRVVAAGPFVALEQKTVQTQKAGRIGKTSSTLVPSSPVRDVFFYFDPTTSSPPPTKRPVRLNSVRRRDSCVYIHERAHADTVDGNASTHSAHVRVFGLNIKPIYGKFETVRANISTIESLRRSRQRSRDN